MGCGSGQKQVLEPMRRNTVTGVLKVTVVDAYIDHMTSSFFSMDPYAIVKLSNQKMQTQVINKGGKQPKFNEAFIFYINSCFKHRGRNLEIELWDRNKTSDS